jgi:hypothetical protein
LRIISFAFLAIIGAMCLYTLFGKQETRESIIIYSRMVSISRMVVETSMLKAVAVIIVFAFLMACLMALVGF